MHVGTGMHKKHVRIENREEAFAAFHLGLHCLQKYL